MHASTSTTTVHLLIGTEMRTLVCFGDRDGLGEIEVSSTENIVCHESIPTSFYEEQGLGGRTINRPREEIRLFHTQPLIVEEEDDDDEDEEVFFESTSIDISDEPLFRETNPALIGPPETPSTAASPSRTPSKAVLAVIDDLEKALDDVDVDQLLEPLPPATPPPPPSYGKPLSLKSILARFRPQQTFPRQCEPQNNPHTNTPKKVVHVVAPLVAPVAEKRPSKVVRGKPRSSRGSLNRLFPIGRHRQKSSKQGSADTALLIPNKTRESDWFLPDESLHALKTEKKNLPQNGTELHQCPPQKRKKGRFFHRLLTVSRLSTGQPDGVVDTNDAGDLRHDETHSLSLEDEADKEKEIILSKPERTFRNDEELVDHLVKVCDTSSSLEEGFNCLQERIRTHSICRGSPTNDAGNPIFSSSFLDMSSFEAPPKATPTTPSSAVPGPPPISAPSKEDPRNDSIPSFSSLEDFLTSVNDSDHSASLEALLFEQELEKLSTEELAELLDEELEKLMRDGLA